MPRPRSKACAIALACSVASLGIGGTAQASTSTCAVVADGWVRCVQPRAGAPLEIEIGGDPARPRDVIVQAKDPGGAVVPVPFPPIPQGGNGSSLRAIGWPLDRDLKGFTLEVLVRDRQTGATLAASSTTIG
jgi:hypothetical protein